MNKDQFWQIIHGVKQYCAGKDRESFACVTAEKLLKYSLDDILDWHLMLERYCGAAYRPELWAAGSALGADYSGDGFIDFASWLISRGKKAYMEALRNPASLTQIPLNGESPSFRRFRFAAYHAYEAKLLRVDPDRMDDLFMALKSHSLDPRTVKELHGELPRCSAIAQEWQDRVFPAGDSGGEAREPQTVEELLGSNRLAIGYVYKNGQCAEYVFHRTPENIAHFLGSRPDAGRIIITDALDRLILDTVGNLIDTCPDQELLREVKKTLVPIQRGEAAAQPLFCPTMDEVDEYYEGQPAPEFGQLQL